MKEELNINEKKVLKAMIKQAWDETHGEFGYSDQIKVSGLNKHEVAGYISSLKNKGYISVGGFDQFYILKKTEEVFKNVKVYYEGEFTLKKNF